MTPDHYDQIFSAHGTIMIFFVAMPFVIGLMNFVVPLQFGVRDVAFPTLNSVGFWLTASGGCSSTFRWSSVNLPAPGGLHTRRSRSSTYSPGVGVDYYAWALPISGVGRARHRHQSRHHCPEEKYGPEA